MYEPHYEEESGGGGFLIGLLCGTALGAAIGLMFAPKAGSEFRQRLYESTGDIRRKGVRNLRSGQRAGEHGGHEGTPGGRARARKRSTAPGSRRRARQLAATAAPPSSATAPACPTSTRARARPAASRQNGLRAESRERSAGSLLFALSLHRLSRKILLRCHVSPCTA